VPAHFGGCGPGKELELDVVYIYFVFGRRRISILMWMSTFERRSIFILMWMSTFERRSISRHGAAQLYEGQAEKAQSGWATKAAGGASAVASAQVVAVVAKKSSRLPTNAAATLAESELKAS
jgi:hypothetical protein